MKFKLASAAGLLLVGFGNASWAVPPLDRPTPPPCSADGRCYANPSTFGVYETRWRRWPVESIDPNAVEKFNPRQLQNQVPPFDAPPAEEEDRKAPPPTISREESAAGASPSGTSNASPGTEGSTPPTTPLRQPGDQTEPVGPRRTLPPYEPQVPGTRSLDSPTGEFDPPPALPFGPAPIQQAGPVREARRAPAIPAAPPARATNAKSRKLHPSSDDPPPSLPGTLATLSN